MTIEIAEQLEKIFYSNFDINNIERIPVVSPLTDETENSVTTFNSNLRNAFLLKPYTSEKIKPLINNIKVNKSAVQTTLIGIDSASKMTKNKTYALQMFALHLNNALIELTNTLGSDAVTNTNNKLFVGFKVPEKHTAIEMKTTLIADKKENRKGLV